MTRGPGRTTTRRPAGPSKAARRPQTVARVRATLAPDDRQGPRFTGRAVVLLLVALLLVGSYTSALRAWWTQRAEIQTTQAEIAMRHDAIEDLEDTKRRFDDPAFIQQQARERFGWVMPGEVGYRVIGSDGEIQGDVAVLSEPAVQREPRWYDTLWASVEGAGSTETGVPVAADPDKVIRDRE